MKAIMKNITKAALFITLVCLSTSGSKISYGQSSKYDFVQSSSPLSDGRVISRTRYPGQSIPDKTTVTPSPTRVASNYPQGTVPTRMQAPVPAGGQAPIQRNAFQVPAANVPPTLNPNTLPNQNAFANQNCATCNTPGFNGGANGQIYPYPASGQNSGQNIAPNNYQYNNGYGNFPAVPNAGPQPLIRLRTLPQNTYLGQGILGQPTAYVPGEPVRNILRYIMP